VFMLFTAITSSNFLVRFFKTTFAIFCFSFVFFNRNLPKIKNNQ
jgi:hypothetical protein